MGTVFIPIRAHVDKYKWLEPRHMVNISDRWNRSKTDDLQLAFFNGVVGKVGRIFGASGMELPRAMRKQRVASLRSSAPWSHFSLATTGSQWRRCCATASTPVVGHLDSKTLWTIVNRNQYDVAGPQIELPAEEGLQYFDLYHGNKLQPERNKAGRVVLSFPSKPTGYGSRYWLLGLLLTRACRLLWRR